MLISYNYLKWFIIGEISVKGHLPFPVSEMNQMLQRQMNLRSGSMGPRTRSMSRSRNLFNRDVDIRARSVSRARSMSRGRSVSRGRPGAANRGGRSRSKSGRGLEYAAF